MVHPQLIAVDILFQLVVLVNGVAAAKSRQLVLILGQVRLSELRMRFGCYEARIVWVRFKKLLHEADLRALSELLTTFFVDTGELLETIVNIARTARRDVIVVPIHERLLPHRPIRRL